MRLSVNGVEREVTSAPGRPLLFCLREELDLTGAKYGCGEGACGACTVLVNGAAVRSCLMSVANAAGKEITTIEGLEKNGRLHPVQDAFIAGDAMQCGYCTAGMILSALGLLRKNPAPTTAQIRSAMEGNLCRCGTQPKIVEAVRAAAGGKGSLRG